eukprot:Em0007g1541a
MYYYGGGCCDGVLDMGDEKLEKYIAVPVATGRAVSVGTGRAVCRTVGTGPKAIENGSKKTKVTVEDIKAFWIEKPKATEMEVFERFPVVGYNTTMHRLIMGARPVPETGKHKRCRKWLSGESDSSKSTVICTVCVWQAISNKI